VAQLIGPERPLHLRVLRPLFFSARVTTMTDIKKYFLRFGLMFVVVAPILYFFQGPTALAVISYKICLSLLGVSTAELVWAVFFKPVFGASEALTGYAKQSVMVFRGMLYAALILAFTLGM